MNKKNQPLGLFLRQPAVALHLAMQHADFREAVDPLPFVPCHMQQVPNQRQITIHRRRLVAPLQLPLRDAPHYVTRNLVQREVFHVWVQLTANTLHIAKTSQTCFQFEIPHNGVLAGTLGLNTEMGFAVDVKRELGEVRCRFFVAFSPSALA